MSSKVVCTQFMGGHPDLKGSVVGLNSAAEERTTPKLVMVKKKKKTSTLKLHRNIRVRIGIRLSKPNQRNIMHQCGTKLHALFSL